MTIEPTPSEPDPIDDPPLDFGSGSMRPKPSSRRQSANSGWQLHQRTNSRTATIRLVFLIGSLFFVIWGMSIAGRTETWRWLFRDPAVVGSDGKSPDSRDSGSTPSPAATIQMPSDDATAIQGPTSDQAGAISELTSTLPVETVSEYELAFAQRFLTSLSSHELYTFWQVVQCAVDQRELPVGETATAAVLVNQLAQQWSLWNQKWDTLFQEANVPADRRAAVMEARDRWESSVLPAMAAVTIRPDESVNQEHLLEFRRTIDRAAYTLVEQYTHVGRPVESFAWFSSWANVFSQPLSIEKQALPAPTMTQLLGQPEAWAGQTISVEGTALRIQRVTAGMNPLNITDYFVIWIRPNHPSMYPYCVYTLLPPDPLMIEKNELEKNVSVPVSVAGQFFKVRLFDAGGKAGQAPLLMASTIQVLPATPESMGNEPFRMPGAVTIVTTLLLIGIIASGIAWLAWRTSQSGRLRGLPTGSRLHSAMDNLQRDDRIETVQQKIKRMEKGGND